MLDIRKTVVDEDQQAVSFRRRRKLALPRAVLARDGKLAVLAHLVQHVQGARARDAGGKGRGRFEGDAEMQLHHTLSLRTDRGE